MRLLLQFFIATFTLSSFAWVAWQGFLLLSNRGQDLEVGQRTLLTGVALIAFICVFLLAAAIRKGAKERIKEALFLRRSELYEGFLVSWQTLNKELPNEQQVQIQLEIEEIKTSIALYASIEVVKNTNQFLSKIVNDAPHQKQEAFESLLLAMRADLGQSNLYPLRNEIKKLFASNHT